MGSIDRMKVPCNFLAVLALGSIWQPLSAATIVSDSFTDGGRTNGADPQDIAWYTNSSTQTLSVENSELRITPTAASQAVVGTLASGITLAVGDYIELSFSFRYAASAPGNSTNGFRFGLYNDVGETMSSDAANRDDPNAGISSVGYYGSISTGSPGTPSNAFYREFGGTNGILTGDDRSSAVGNNSANMGLNDTDVHTAVMRITATAGGVSLTGSIDGITFASGPANTPTADYRTFNQIAFASNVTNTSLFLDDITLVYVPEPAAALLGGLGALFSLCRRRRPDLS
jgi:hypothetical protein